jgi:hypothetical protein
MSAVAAAAATAYIPLSAAAATSLTEGYTQQQALTMNTHATFVNVQQMKYVIGSGKLYI